MTLPTPFRVGIIGAENTHAAAIAKELNIHHSPAGFAVTHLWGETENFAADTAKAGLIPTIVRDPIEMLGKIDGLMVDHRDGRYHLAAARPFVEAGIPVFVDKPLSTSLAEAREFLAFRREKHVAVTSMSAVANQGCVTTIREQLKTIGRLRTVHVNGPGDAHSPYGGIFFYGIHQMDLMVELLGPAAQTVMASEEGGAFTGVIRYPDGVSVTMSMAGAKSFSLTAIGVDGSFHTPIVFDANMYAPTTRIFTAMFKSGVEPFDDVRMLAPIAVLETLQQALTSGRPVAVPPCGFTPAC